MDLIVPSKPKEASFSVKGVKPEMSANITQAGYVSVSGTFNAPLKAPNCEFINPSVHPTLSEGVVSQASVHSLPFWLLRPE
jgi:hypothetical protein